MGLPEAFHVRCTSGPPFPGDPLSSMGTVRQLDMNPTLLHSPRRRAGVCADCFNLTRGFTRCFACAHLEHHLATMVPISYSVGHEYLHHILADYKRTRGLPADLAAGQVAAMLSMFLARHEACVARAAGVPAFGLVTTVPSSDSHRDEHHPLRRLVGEQVPQTGGRHERLLRRTSVPLEPRAFDARRYRAVRPLEGESVLLIDDTWTTGASMQSAAAALKAAGAATVAAIVVGRHVNREWGENDRRLDALPFNWSRCPLCAGAEESSAASGEAEIRLPGGSTIEQAA
jgi:predicted amidophosphoribosyltransferase